MNSWPKTIVEEGVAFRNGSQSSVRLTTELLARADRHDSRLGTYLFRFDESALQAAEDADLELASGHDRGPLHGIPLAVKDNIATSEQRLTAQSRSPLDGWSYIGDAPVVGRLRSAGAVIIGKTTLNEFAIGLPDPDKQFPIPVNPWDDSLWAGGSSSGTANGVAAGLFLGGLGTDTGGSIRLPSAFCGVTGLKPTFGLVPKSGCVPLGFSLDAVGPISRTAHDCALLLDAIAGADPSDPETINRPREAYAALIPGDVRGLRLGVDRGLQERSTPQTAEALDGALEVLVAGGVELVDIALPFYEPVETATWVILQSEGLAFHRSNLQKYWNDFTRSSRTALAMGALYSGADYVQAQRLRSVARQATLRLMDTAVDFVVTPTVSGGARPPDVEMGELSEGLHTFFWNAVGFPAISIPMGCDGDGLPLGLQLAGSPFSEGNLICVADWFQRHTDWHAMRPTAD
jgi:aspartyl-tRNA(Asn)/glutamyl-tRNA(Gln) amidotransferase subunit A